MDISNYREAFPKRIVEWARGWGWGVQNLNSENYNVNVYIEDINYAQKLKLYNFSYT